MIAEMTPAYIREIEHAWRLAHELAELLAIVPEEASEPLTITELAQAIGLASTARDALCRALAARGGEIDG